MIPLQMSKQKFWDSIWLGRILTLFLGLALVGSGLRAMFRDRLTYSNYWGGPVFAPFAMMVGVFVLIVVVIKWNKFDERERRPRLKRKAARKAKKAEREAEQYRSTIDDFDKPWRGQS